VVSTKLRDSSEMLLVNDLMRHPLGLATLLSILAVIVVGGCSRRMVSVEEVDKMIKEQVPLGSDKERVRAFIDNLKIDSLEIGRDGLFHKAAELGDRISEFTGAVIFKSKSDGILTFDNIVIQFYIDREGRMIGYTVKELGSD
jgi:hypothetical protein